MFDYHELQGHIQDFFATIGANAGADYDQIKPSSEEERLEQGDVINNPHSRHLDTPKGEAPCSNEKGTLKH